MFFKNHEQIFKTCFPILKGYINSGNLNKFAKYYLDGVADEADSYKLSAIVEGGSKVTYDSKTIWLIFLNTLLYYYYYSFKLIIMFDKHY